MEFLAFLVSEFLKRISLKRLYIPKVGDLILIKNKYGVGEVKYYAVNVVYLGVNLRLQRR